MPLLQARRGGVGSAIPGPVLRTVAEGFLDVRLAPVVLYHARSIVAQADRIRLAIQDGEIGVAHGLRDGVLAEGPGPDASLATALVAAPQRLADVLRVPAILEDGPSVGVQTAGVDDRTY